MHHTDNTRTGSTRRSYAEILATVKAQRLRGDSTPATKLHRRPPADVLRKGSSADLGGFTAEQHAIAARCIEKAGGLVAAVAQIATLRQHQRTGGFYITPMPATTQAPVRKAVTVNTAGTKPAPVPAAKLTPTMKAPGEDYGVDFNPDDGLHVHARQLRETAAAAARLHASMRTAMRLPHASVGPDAAPTVR